MKGFSRRQLQMMGFNFVLEHLELRNCYGEEKKQQLDWYSRPECSLLFQQLDQLSRFVALHQAKPSEVDALMRILHHFKEIRGILRKIEQGTDFLDETEFFDLKNFAIDMEHLIREVSRFEFHFDALWPVSLQPVIKILNPEDQITRTFCMYDCYSLALTRIRKEKQVLEKKIACSDGDPADLLNQRRIVTEQERAEENQIKKRLVEEISPFLPLINKDIRYVAELDFIIGKSSLAIRFRGTKPNFIETDLIQVEAAVNPYVQSILRQSGKEFTPVSMTLKNGANVLTGANMGGKTVALATMTLNILLAHCGFFVFADSVTLPVLDFIFFLSSDEQSMAQGLSSYGAEIAEVTRLLNEMKGKHGFCALDEFARGTNPEEGQSLVRGFLQYAEKYPSFCLVSTHFSDVVMEGMKHFQVVGLKRAQLSQDLPAKTRQHVSFLQDLMDFTIEAVEWDSPTPQDALRVAALMGIQEEFLALVKNNIRRHDG